MPLVQEQTEVFGPNISFTIKEDYLLNFKIAENTLCCLLISTCKNLFITENYTSRLIIGILFKNII